MNRSVNTVIAALSGAARYALLFAFALLIMAPVSRIFAGYFIRDRFDLLPEARFTYSSNSGGAIDVTGVSPSEADKVRDALARLGLGESGGFTVRVESAFEDCLSCEGEYQPLSDVIRVRRDVVRGGGAALRRTLAHEVGHFFDQRYLSDADREEYMRLRGISSDLEWGSFEQTWEERPAEDFAEVFAVLIEPEVAAPPATDYGPVRDPGRFEPLLARMEVRERRSASWPAPAQIVQREIEYLVTLMGSGFPAVTLAAMFIAFATYGATRSVLDSLEGGQYCDFPRRPVSFSA